MKLRVYIDTSVFSALFDDRWPQRRDEPRVFWGRLSEFEAGTSDLAHLELGQTSAPKLRRQLVELLSAVRRFPLTRAMRELGDRYVHQGVFPPGMINDALHVAAAVIARQDVLVSWNFRHLVNRRRRAMVNEVNVLLSLPTIEILAPSEL